MLIFEGNSLSTGKHLEMLEDSPITILQAKTVMKDISKEEEKDSDDRIYFVGNAGDDEKT